MKPQTKLATAWTPDGGEMTLYHHDRDFSIRINGLELMNTRQHESEQELARLGCAYLAGKNAPCVLIGGLGLGYTLRQTLDILAPDAVVIVSELMQAVVDWNRTYLRDINGQLLEDQRTQLVVGDIFPLISQAQGRFDAILLDVDNGPNAMTDSGNQRLYGPAGINACRRALKKHGCLAVWSTDQSRSFERTLVGCGFQVRRYRVKNYGHSKSKPLFIWVAAQDAAVLPAGGDAPALTARKAPGEIKSADH